MPEQSDGLGPDDMKLWDAVARTIRPLPGRRAPPPANAPSVQDAPPRQDDKPRPPTAQRATPDAPATAPRLAGFDRQLAQKISRGRVSVDATIDLHGLSQDEAERRLYSFLLRCHERGRRLVLVITGKGRAGDDAMSIMADHEPGVLRRVVPHWLAQPRFSAIVVAYRQAARQHGGAGALYVQLRRARRQSAS